jgi:thiosulfate/3-mercaptopyruvate sulfurtransferase
MIQTCRRSTFAKISLATLGVLCLALAVVPQGFAAGAKTTEHDPWEKSQIVMPEDLARLLVAPQGQKPLVVYVGFEFLFKSGHILGAKYVGTGRDAKGVEALKKWAKGVARDQEIVIYCGCCPFKDCPNIRPAYEALHQMGLRQIKVLYLENGFAKNWLNMGYPSEKGEVK